MSARTGSLYWLGEIKYRVFPKVEYKHLLWALVDFIDEDDTCYPSQVTIAKVMQVSERKVRGLLAEMEAAGLVTRCERRDALRHRTSDEIWLNRDAITALPELDLPARSAGRCGSTYRQDEGRPTGKNEPTYRQKTARPTGTLLPPNHPVEPPREPPREPTPVVPAASFEAFWSAYPRHEGKGAARKAWERAVLVEAPDAITTGALRYASDPNRLPEFTAHPTTWLNQQRWDDDPLPPRRNGGAREHQQATVNAATSYLAKRGYA